MAKADDSYHGLTHLTRQLAWNGVVTEARTLANPETTIAQQLLGAVKDAAADLLVLGGYGHSSLREQVLGGVTRKLVDAADLPVFLMH